MDYYADTLGIARVMYYDFVDMLLQSTNLLLLKTGKALENWLNQIIV